MNRDLFSGTICQCGGVARGPKVHFVYFAGWQAEKGWKCRLLLTCECFAPGIGKTGYPEHKHRYGHGYGHIYGHEWREIRATICEIRVEHKIALSMVSLSSTDVGRNPAPLSSVSVQCQSESESRPDAAKLKINFVTVAHRRSVIMISRYSHRHSAHSAMIPLMMRSCRWNFRTFGINIFVRGSLLALPIARHTSLVHPSRFCRSAN